MDRNLVNIDNDIRQWLVRHGHYELFNVDEEVFILKSKAVEDQAKKLYGKLYTNYAKEVRKIFKEQRKLFPATAIIRNLFRMRPQFKKEQEDDISRIVSSEVGKSGFLTSNDVGGKKNIERFEVIVLEFGVDGYNFGGNDGLENIKGELESSVNERVQDIGGDIDSSFNLTSGDMLDYLDNYAADRVSQINETTRKQLKETIVKGYKDGKGPSGIKKMIDKAFVGFGGGRSKTIAMTELSIASGEARQQVYTRRSIPYKSWVTRGPRPCPICLGNESEGRIPMGNAFSGGMSSDPAHPRCLCVVVPEIDDGWCGGKSYSKAVYQDACPGYTWYGGEGNEKTSKKPLTKPKGKEVKWKPSGTLKEAKKFASESKFKQTFYHGTRDDNYKKIMEGGFKGSHQGALGPGIYLTEDKNIAKQYGWKVLKNKINVKDGKIFNGGIYGNEHRKYLDKATSLVQGRYTNKEILYGNDSSINIPEEIKTEYFKAMKKEGYVGYMRSKSDDKIEEIVMFNKKDIMSF